MYMSGIYMSRGKFENYRELESDFYDAQRLASPAGRLRRESLRYRAKRNARGAVEIAQDSPVGCKPWLGCPWFGKNYITGKNIHRKHFK